MPIWKRKRVQFIQPSDDLASQARNNPSKQVFCLPQTGEIFPDYKSYSARLSFYRTKHFQCEVTGKGGLDYFQAVESELLEARNLQARFPASLKRAVLRAVQWQIVGRLDNLVDAVYERFKERFFSDEKVLLDVKGDKFWARVVKTYLPGSQTEPHRVGGNLKLSYEEAQLNDPPDLYVYKIQIIEEATGSTGSSATQKLSDGSQKWSGSVMEVRCECMSRDRLTFSKSLLRKFLRDSVDRESTVASPWLVKANLIRQFDLDSTMPEEMRSRLEDSRKGDAEKRKKNWDDKDGPPPKKSKKSSDTKEAVRETQEPEAKKKKAIKYPIEDLEVEWTEKDKKLSRARPQPLLEVSFGEDFEQFFMSWCYLQTFGVPLNLSSFTLEQFQRAIYHSDETPCFLIAEIHTCLAYNIRQVPGHRNTASTSLYEAHSHGDQDMFSTPIEELLTALGSRGGNWERAPLRSTPHREGWQDAIIGLLKDHATDSNFPRLRQVLTHLLLHPLQDQALSDYESNHAFLTASYNLIPPGDKIALLAFLCDRSVSSKSVRGFMEGCEERLTGLRKEKTEINRERKRCLEQIQEYTDDAKTHQSPLGDDSKDGCENINSDVKPESEDDLERKAPSDSETCDRSSRSTPATGGKANKVIRLKVPSLAQQRKAERERAAQEKVALTETRRLKDEIVKLDENLKVVDLDFRSLMAATRTRPIGKDRFFYRYWWLDGLGGTACSTGRLYVQGPSELDREVLLQCRDLPERIEEELGSPFLDFDHWGYYDNPDQIDTLIASLSHKGRRELQLKNALSLWKLHIDADLEKRSTVKAGEIRRSSRQTRDNKEVVVIEDYFTWTNRRAPNGTASNSYL